MKILKWVVIGVLGLAVLAIAGAAIFALSFDPNRYKGEIERIAKERTGRTLKLAGDLKVAIFPSLGTSVQGATLSERASEQPFVSVDSAHGAVALIPLLHGQVVVDRIDIKGLKASVVKGKDGRFNFSDLLEEKKAPAGEPKGAPPASEQKGAPPAAQRQGGPVAFDIAGVNIDDASIDYKDLASGRELAFSGMKLATGRISEKADGKLELALSLKGKNPDVDAHLSLSGDYKVDLPAKSFAFSKVDGALKGTFDKDSVDAKLAAPRIDITKDGASGEAATLQLHRKGPQGAMNADLKLSALRADPEKETMSAELTGKVDESTLQAKLGYAKGYTFDVNVDKLNLDQYFPPKKEPAAAPAGSDASKAAGAAPAKAAAPAPKEADTPVDLSFLRDLNASGRLQFGALQVKGLKLANLKAEVKAANGRLDVAPHTASLYDGTLSGALSAQAAGNRIALKETLANISIGPLLRDAAKQDRLEGRGNVALDVAGAGASVNAIKKSLDGTAKVSLRDGAIKGIDIGALLQKVKSLGKSDEGSASTRDQTSFSELNASFVIKNGVAHNQDLDVKAPLFRLGGAGDIDIGNSSLNYTAKASVVASTKGQGGKDLGQLSGLTVPVQLAGPFDAIKYKVDYGAVASEVVKSKVGEKVKESVGSKLKGLFGR